MIRPAYALDSSPACSSPHLGALISSSCISPRQHSDIASRPLIGAGHHVGNTRGHSGHNGSLLMFIFPTRACVVVVSMWFVLTMALYYGGRNILVAHKATTHQRSPAHPPSFTPRSALPSAGPTAGDYPLLSSPPFCDSFPYDCCK